ncbi:hypothetical protein ABZ672_56355, partial [Streptomyces mirabilis]|uniref:hypothetical protein n=1 Tax=Streptomyces mirabilis TaxID=68239 RepID=UPI0033F16489
MSCVADAFVQESAGSTVTRHGTTKPSSCWSSGWPAALFGTPGFAARLFATEDADFSLALVRAYNDWHI